jgi:hypothetical protein
MLMLMVVLLVLPAVAIEWGLEQTERLRSCLPGDIPSI